MLIYLSLSFIIPINISNNSRNKHWQLQNASPNKYRNDCESNYLTNEGDINYILDAKIGNETLSLTLNSLLPMTIIDEKKCSKFWD